jgi:hypothetical protein
MNWATTAHVALQSFAARGEQSSSEIYQTVFFVLDSNINRQYSSSKEGKPDCVGKISCTFCPGDNWFLFVAQSLYWIQAGCAACRINAEKDPHCG